MKNFRIISLSTFMIIASLLAACGPKPAVPSATQPPAGAGASTSTKAPVAASTETPSLVATVTKTIATLVAAVTGTGEPAVSATPTLITFEVSGPSMEVGSHYAYVDGSILVPVPAGEFTMGNNMPDSPTHKVSLSEFWIYRTEVTNQMYARCVELGKCTDPDVKLNIAYNNPLRINEPVTGVKWAQAEDYCTFVHGRLPTEAEWEKTARGPNANIFPWGKENPACTLANIGRCKPSTTLVTLYPQGKSYYDALDMAGNVFEWVADWYVFNYYGTAPTADPGGPTSGQNRSVRSSAYNSDSFLAESARRFQERPIVARKDLGFRCVIEDPSYFAPWCTQVSLVGGDVNGTPADVVIPKADCPLVSVSTGGYCGAGNKPTANVTFGPSPLPPGTLTTLPGAPGVCTAGPNLFICYSGGTASIQALCTVPPPPVPPGCAVGYTLDAGTNTCVYSGSATEARECLPGATYDPLTQCCTSTPGTGASYSLCPVDAPYPAGGSCWAWPISDYGPLQTIAVSLGSCGGNGGGTTGTPNSCNVQACTVGTWDNDLCCCSRTPGACDGSTSTQ